MWQSITLWRKIWLEVCSGYCAHTLLDLWFFLGEIISPTAFWSCWLGVCLKQAKVCHKSPFGVSTIAWKSQPYHLATSERNDLRFSKSGFVPFHWTLYFLGVWEFVAVASSSLEYLLVNATCNVNTPNFQECGLPETTPKYSRKLNLAYLLKQVQ